MKQEPYVPKHKEETISAIESLRRERSVKKMKKFVVKQLAKGNDIIPASTSRFSGALESTTTSSSNRNAYIVSKVQSELSSDGVSVETIDHIIDADSTDATLYGFKRVDSTEEAHDK